MGKTRLNFLNCYKLLPMPVFVQYIWIYLALCRTYSSSFIRKKSFELVIEFYLMDSYPDCTFFSDY